MIETDVQGMKIMQFVVRFNNVAVEAEGRFASIRAMPTDSSSVFFPQTKKLVQAGSLSSLLTIYFAVCNQKRRKQETAKTHFLREAAARRREFRMREPRARADQEMLISSRRLSES